MKTDDLIKALAADTAAPTMTSLRVWLFAGVGALLIAATVFSIALGPRADIATAAETLRFMLKPLESALLAATAFATLIALARPDGDTRRLATLAAAPVLLVIAVVVELAVLPPELWEARWIGSNSLLCLTYIPLIGIGPLAALMLAMRHGAPTRPRLAGAVAGLMAGGVAAALYALHCPDDSPLFVATWYTIAIAALAAIGALVAPRVARW
ncbi:MAG: DUF1109 family protein [Rhizobiaceae bacterium]|nr:DUF1109 family protein [Rhizobiaceae bacterium]